MENRIPTVTDFDRVLAGLFRQAEQDGKTELLVNSGELHRLVGGYPDYQNRITTCCGAMRRIMMADDRVVHQPPKGNGASLDIIYALPRLRLVRHFVAYHKFSEWGNYETNHTKFSHYSNRSPKFLEKSLGQRIWVVGGEKVKQRNAYTLLSHFTPDLVEPNPEGGYIIEGLGTGFNPPINLSSESWFIELLEEQHNFSLGINEIKNVNVIERLLALGPKQKDEPIHYADELPSSRTYWEGTAKQIKVNRYERDPKARQSCIEHYGAKCLACCVDFEKTYGELGKGYIHVHHIRPLSTIREGYVVNPIEDLRPVCPNCHAMLHRKDPLLTIDELKEILTKMTSQ